MLDKNEVRQVAHNFADLVRQDYDPLRVILFGSYVHGNPNENSDIDIAVIFKDYVGDWYGTWTDLVGLSWRINLDIEPHMLDEDDDPLGFLEHVKKTGEVIYERKKGGVTYT